MDNHIAIRGFTLLELIIVMAVIGVLLVAIIGNCTNFMNRAKFQSTVREMGSIAEAAIDYYESSQNPNDPDNPGNLTWPSTDASKLGSPYMPQAITSNPFGYGYQLSFANNMVIVSTMIPNGISIDPTEGSFLNITPMSTGKQVSITQSVPNEFSARLTYDLEYIYK